jgi:hypothetical protein
MEAYTRVGEDGLVRMDLIGEDSRVINTKAMNYTRYAKQRILITDTMDFGITAAAETARLVLYNRDLFGRTISLASVDLILLKVGEDEITPSIQNLEPYIIRYPYADMTVEGGDLLVMGVARPVNNKPLIFELIDQQGQVIASRQLQVAPPSGDLSHTPFQIVISYKVTDTTPVRLSIRQESDQRVPGTVAVESMTVILKP